MSRNSIKIRNIHLPHILTRRILPKNRFNQFSEMLISEYDLEEIIPTTTTETHYYPKQMYYNLLGHLHEILRRNIHKNQTIFSFTIYQNIEEDNYEILEKDIQIEAIDSDITLEMLFDKINILIDGMEERVYPIKQESNPDFRLIFSKYEIFKPEHIIINKEKIFKTEHCVICTEAKPNILFCNCGHLIACKECWENLNNKKYICMSCRKPNDIVRIIE